MVAINKVKSNLYWTGNHINPTLFVFRRLWTFQYHMRILWIYAQRKYCFTYRVVYSSHRCISESLRAQKARKFLRRTQIYTFDNPLSLANQPHEKKAAGTPKFSIIYRTRRNSYQTPVYPGMMVDNLTNDDDGKRRWVLSSVWGHSRHTNIPWGTRLSSVYVYFQPSYCHCWLSWQWYNGWISLNYWLTNTNPGLTLFANHMQTCDNKS